LKADGQILLHFFVNFISFIYLRFIFFCRTLKYICLLNGENIIMIKIHK